MKRAKKDSCSSKYCFVLVATIVCALYFVYYRAAVADSISYELSASFDRVDAPSSLYGVCPLPRISTTSQIVAKDERKCEVEVPLTILNDEGRIVINQASNATEKQIRSCYARPLHDSTSWPWTWLKAIAVFFSRNQKLFWYTLKDAGKIEDAFIEVDCLGYNNVHGRVRKREEIRKRTNDTPDVFVIHVRSLTSNLFAHQTIRFLEEAMGAVHFHNYQSLGNDYADFGAMLAGGLASPLFRDRVGSKEVPPNLPRSSYDDPCFVARTTSFLPRLFQQQGYATLIADENRVHEEGFERGCGWEPTNLYTPIVHRFSPYSGCKFANYVLEYFRKFVEVHDGSAKFVTLRILYDDSVVDDELVETLSRLKEKMSNSYIFFITDAYGDVNLSPVPTPKQNLWISAPEQKRHTLAMANLLSNQHALTTPFDVHATMRVIAGLPNTQSGSSLIEKLRSAVRDCLRLPIPLQHCPCPVARRNYTDIATQFEAAETALEPLSSLLKRYGCKQWDVERVYGIRRLEKLPLVEIYVAVRPLERNGFTHKYDRLDFPVFKLVAEETQTASSLVFTGLPELTVALKPMDYHLSPCMKGHWLRPFCYCESWKM